MNRAFLGALDAHSGRVSFKEKRGGFYRDITFQDLKNDTLAVSRYLINSGLRPGDRVLIAAENSVDWMSVFTASILTGGIVIPVSPSVKSDLLKYIIQDSRPSVMVVQGRAGFMEELYAGVPTIISVGDTDQTADRMIHISDLKTGPSSSETMSALEKLAVETESDSPVIILYTAKETGNPRGAVFDHSGVLLTLDTVSRWFTLDEYDIGFTTLNWSFYPSLIAALHYLMSGIGNALAERIDTIFDDLQQTSPTVTMTSPYAFERIYKRIMQELNLMPESKRKVFEWALTLGKQYRASESTASKELRESYTRTDMAIFGQMRAILGGRLHRIYSAGANLSKELIGFAEAIGLLPLSVYGIVEAGGFPTVSRPFARRTGSCGQVAPGFQIRISDEGEVLVRGKTVITRYGINSADQEPVTDEDGWLHTEDLGRFDQEGYLYLTGHKESLFMLSQGHKIVPSRIENLLTEKPYISQSFVWGEGRSYVSALIVPDMDYIRDYINDNNVSLPGNGPDVNTFDPYVKGLLDEAISDVNMKLNVWEKIEAYTIVDTPLYSDASASQGLERNGRNSVLEKYTPYLNAMYPDAMREENEDITQFQLEPDQLRDLVEKQDILNAWMEDAGIGFLLDLARSKNIDALSMVNICETATSIAQMQSEEKPVSTALIVGDPVDISKVLPVGDIQFLRYDHIRRMQNVVLSLAKIIDGVVLGYGIDKQGYLRRVHKLALSADETDNFLLGPQFRRHAAISKECDAIVFYVPIGGKQVRVFSDGQMVARYSNGNWIAESVPQIEDLVARLAEQNKCAPNLLKRLFRCAFLMSEKNQGAIFILGDSDTILKKSDPPELSHFATIGRVGIEELSDSELINFAKQDGATIIDLSSGAFSACMVLLRPSAETQAEIGIGKGARHSSASKMSAEADCLAITVSQDGPITVYDRGERILSI